MFRCVSRRDCVCCDEVDTMRDEWNWISILPKVFVFGAAPKIFVLNSCTFKIWNQPYLEFGTLFKDLLSILDQVLGIFQQAFSFWGLLMLLYTTFPIILNVFLAWPMPRVFFCHWEKTTGETSDRNGWPEAQLGNGRLGLRGCLCRHCRCRQRFWQIWISESFYQLMVANFTNLTYFLSLSIVKLLCLDMSKPFSA